MSQTKIRHLFLIITLIITSYVFAGVRIVVLGSSTAAGSGPVSISNSWVVRYTTFLRSTEATHSLYNLAKGGYLTYNAMPTNYVPPAGVSFYPDTIRNITKALSLLPDAIIVNFPSNDTSNGVTIDQQIENYNTIIAEAAKLKIPVWICTAQPVNYGTNQSSRDKIKALKERIQTEYKEKSIDFYTGLCDSNGSILAQYDSGDGLHLNDAAHEILFNRVVEADILKSIGYKDENPLLQNQVLIDFGEKESPAPWNNITSISINSTGSEINNLYDIEGQATGMGIRVSKSFYGKNTYGAISTQTSLNMPESVSSDNFYTGGGFGELTLTGLNTSQLYSFVFFGSRMETGGLSRETSFTLKGENEKNGLLETSNNTIRLLQIDAIKPATNKSITIQITHGAGNQNSSKYTHISAMKMYAESTNSISQSESEFYKIYYENGKVYAENSGEGSLNIYNLTGKLVYSQIFSNSMNVLSTELCPNEKGMLIVVYNSGTQTKAKKVLFN